MKHNKKRNTAFLYESLVKELTKTIVRQQEGRKEKIVNIIKKSSETNNSFSYDFVIKISS